MDMAASIASFNVFTPQFVNAKVPITPLVCPNSVFFKSKVSPIPIKFHSLRIYHRTKTTKMYNFPTIASSVDDGGEVDSESINSASNDSHTGTTVDIKLPRRSLLVQFTCNSCGESTQRLINRLAYEHGTVFVQCAGCLQHHKLVDNLNLVVEYDLREEVSEGAATDKTA